MFACFTSVLTVWKKLEEENQEFFKAYYLRLMVKHQIMEYNKLLEQQLHHMRKMYPTGAAPIQSRNVSHVPSSKICLGLYQVSFSIDLSYVRIWICIYMRAHHIELHFFFVMLHPIICILNFICYSGIKVLISL